MAGCLMTASDPKANFDNLKYLLMLRISWLDPKANFDNLKYLLMLRISWLPRD
jgi:hypothetical protein